MTVHLFFSSFLLFFLNFHISAFVQSLYRTCIPAEHEPMLNSITSSCYPLVYFTRPFCQNNGIALPNYVYQTPNHQNDRNHEANKDYDAVMKIGVSNISRFLNIDINTVRKCLPAVVIGYCHLHFPSCDRTRSVFQEQKICRESCLELTHICGEMWKMFERYYAIFHQELKLSSCEQQPPRNAGDSPECWYFNGDANSTAGKLLSLRSTTWPARRRAFKTKKFVMQDKNCRNNSWSQGYSQRRCHCSAQR
jgi:hypothetical protein